VVDSSALVAICLLEVEAANFAALTQSSSGPRVSAANVLETLMVLDGRTGADNRPELLSMIELLGLRIEPVTTRQVWLAHDAFRRFGKGFHPARLNFGDCFAYALAREFDMPLLFKGNDFPLTDIRSAV
jgi:ribonuclease VapC